MKFGQTSATVIKLIAFGVLFAIMTFYDLDMEQMDIKTAFFLVILTNFFFMEMSKEYEYQ